jgi:coatomer subunit beta'
MKKFEHKKKLVMKSGKVKSVDFHPTFPWVLVGFYSGSLTIYDYNTQAALHYLEVTTQNPIRTAKFIAEKNWYDSSNKLGS